MTASFTGPDLLDGLKTALEARGGLSGVTISTVPLGTDTAREQITFLRIDQTDEHTAMAPKSYESMSVSGVLVIQKPGLNNAAGKAARDRAFALLEEVKAAMVDDPTVGGAVDRAWFAGYQLTPLLTDPPGHMAQIEFTIQAEAWI